MLIYAYLNLILFFKKPGVLEYPAFVFACLDFRYFELLKCEVFILIYIFPV